MMIFIGIMLIFGGIVAYVAADVGHKSKGWLCMLGFLLMLTGLCMICAIMNRIV